MSRRVPAVKDSPSTPGAEAVSRPPTVRGGKRTGVVVRVLRHLVRRPTALTSAVFVVALVGVAGYVWVFHPLDPVAQELTDRFAPPSAEHLLGLDHLGRDTFARLLHATRVALLSVAQGVGVAALLGVGPGVMAGYRGGRVDAALSRVADALIAFPGIVLALAIVAALGPSLTNAMIAIGIINAPRVFRVVRSAAANIRDNAFIDAARLLDASRWQIVVRHVLPNVGGVMVVQLALISARVLLAESSLSYLGLGVQPPTATWGAMIRDAQPYMHRDALNMIIPGFAIMITALALNYLADGIASSLRASVEPRGEDDGQ